MPHSRPSLMSLRRSTHPRLARPRRRAPAPPWPVGGRAIAPPAVAFTVTTRHPASTFADLLLSEAPLADSRPTFVDRGSIFRPRPAEGPLTIPPDAARPSALPDLERPPTGPAPVVVAPTPQEVEAHPEAEVVLLGDAIAFLRRPKAF